MNIHFQLRQQGASYPRIVLQVFDSRFDGRKFMYSTGISIEASHWDKRRNRAKIILAKAKEYEQLNKHLDQLEQTVIGYLSERHKHDSLSRTELKDHINGGRVNERKETESLEWQSRLFFDTWDRIIEESKTSKGESITAGTKKQKRQTLKLVQKFSKEKGKLISFQNIDMGVYHALDTYMKELSLSGNSRGKHFKEIKAVLREAMDRDIKVNLSFQKKSFKVIRQPADTIYLTESEIRKLIALDLPSSLAPHRDIFVMACFVGARHSDWSQIRRANIVCEGDKELLKIQQTKTGDIVHIPVHPVVRMILNKYHGEPPRVISNQKFNEALKDIGREAHLGQVIVEGQIREKWAEVTTHTARRSFATNAYLSRSLEVYQIMKCTGHKTESSFLAYLKLNGRDYAMQAAESDFFKSNAWSEFLMIAS